VAAAGTAPLSYKWMKNGTPITGATSSTYTTPATTTSDNSSQFTVMVGNSAGSVTSNPATLTVSAITSQLTANPSTLSFGNINVGASSSQSVTLTNSSTANITISNVSISGPGFNVSGVPSGLILATGKTATLNVTFAPTASGSVTGSVIVTSNATNSPATISLSGSGVPTVATGSQFYVSPTGNDANSGTNSSAPWRTIQKAMNNATAGSTVNIMAGTYHERLTLGVSGTAGNYITFQPNGFSVPSGGCGGYTGVPCGGDQVIIDYGYLGTVSDGVPFLGLSGKSDIRVQGITFQNFTTYELNFLFNTGVNIGSSNFIEFKYNKFLSIKDTAPHDGTSALGVFRISASNNVWVYGNEFGNTVSNYGETLTNDQNSTFFTAENNWIHDTDAIGIDVHGGANNYTIRGNKLEYISIKRDGSVWYGQSSTAIYNDGGNTGVMERNFIDHAGQGFQALAEPGQPAAHDVTIRNNVVQNSLDGIVLGTWYSNTDGSSVYNINVFNNTFYSNVTGIVVRPMTSASVSWENNIFANNGTAYVNTLNWNPGTANYNLYFGGGTGPGANSVTLNPLFNNALAGDFSLQPTSPAINAGDPSTSATVVGAVDFAGNPRILGGRIDIGAYSSPLRHKRIARGAV
jgi:Abnormal spindle-like microcephaly-assoc'd, ASPM-SPD-2-Hydin